MHNIVIETNRAGHHTIWCTNAIAPGGVTCLGPIDARHGDAIDVIPKALNRARAMGYNPNPNVELRRFG